MANSFPAEPVGLSNLYFYLISRKIRIRKINWLNPAYVSPRTRPLAFYLFLGLLVPGALSKMPS